MLKKPAQLFLVLTVALWCFSCARPRVQPPEVAETEKEAACDVFHLKGELARYEEELVGADEERTNYLIRLARLYFILGELSPKTEKLQYFEKGRYYSEILTKEEPLWPEGHYWLGLNLCGLAEQGGARRGLKMVPEIVTEMEMALKGNPAYDQAGPHRVLGRLYYECPQWPLSVGNLAESLKHLSAAVAIAPENCTNHLFLAETLFKLGKKEEARKELEEVFQAPRHSLCPQFLEEDRQAARQLLAK